MKKLLVFVLPFFSFNSKAEEFVGLFGLNMGKLLMLQKLKKKMDLFDAS